MRIAIISDIHSNLEALTKALEIIESKNILEIVCLGDIIGYGANPNECLSLIKNATKHVTLGNHDEAVFNSAMAYHFNRHARSAVLWTVRQLSDEGLDYLRNLPITLKLWDTFFTHASPRSPQEWNYILTPADAKENMDHFSQSVCFVGHSHIPGIFCDSREVSRLERGSKYIINVGSVGQPRDHDKRLSFGIFDTDEYTYENIRSDYDVNKASEKILNAGLPPSLAERILVGN
jgi:predicted phosphodiesterase